MPIRILIADKLAPEGAQWLQSQGGVEVQTRTGLSGDELAAALREHDGAVVRSTVQVTGEVIERAMRSGGARFRAVARAGVGVDNIDLPAATRFGVAVMNSASASTITTAEHAFALMIALARNIAPAARTMAEGGWDRNRFTGAQLHGRTLGVVGLGRIGQTIARRALAFGMKVVAYDPLVNAPTALDGHVRMLPSFDELIAAVDIVSFHVPKTEQTANMLAGPQFAIARPGLLVVNAARGGIVDEQALIEALDAGRCAGAAIDVFTEEPPPEDSPLRRHPKILCTPHLGASTVEAQEAVAVDACRALLGYLRGEGLSGAVNAGGLELDLSARQRAFVDLAERMVALLGAAAAPRRIGQVRLTLRGNTLAGRADTIARFALARLLATHLDQPINVINAGLVAEERGIRLQTMTASDQGEDRLALEIEEHDRVHRVEAAIYADGQPRITSLLGYGMDMVPAGHMVVLTNTDEPGRIGVVGGLFGDAGLNIAEMVIGRKDRPGAPRPIAMMIIKLDQEPPAGLLERLRHESGILSVAPVTLPPLEPPKREQIATAEPVGAHS